MRSSALYRRGLVIIIVVSFVSVATAGFCDDPLRKLGRGAANILMCPIEITHQIQQSNNADGVWAGCTVGPIKGLGMMVVRGVVGIYEVVTFMMPFPEDYKPILTDPEFFFEESSY
jgi:putative exosortase-associated protein (TIGR04073 family)